MPWLHRGKFMDVKWLKTPTLAALQVPESIWELRSNVHELLKNRTYVGKKMLNFLGASFLALMWKPTFIRAAWEYQPKSKWKIRFQKKFVRYSHQIFYFLLCYISFYISQSADIIFHKFLELHSFNIIWKKNFFSTNSLKPLHLFNGQNSRGMMLDESFLSMIPYYLWWPNFIQMLLMEYNVF